MRPLETVRIGQASAFVRFRPHRSALVRLRPLMRNSFYSQYKIRAQDFKLKWTIRNKKSNGLKIKTGRFIEMNRTFQTEPPGIEIKWYFEMTEARFSRKYPGESGGSSSDTKVDDQMTQNRTVLKYVRLQQAEYIRSECFT